MCGRFCSPRALLALLLAAVATASCGPSTAYPDIRIGNPIPEFELPTLGGDKVASRSLEGEPVVLNFWATWCGPCRKEIPVLQAIERGGIAKVVAVSIDDDKSLVAPFVERHGMDYTVLLDGPALFRRMNGTGVPYTLVLDPSLRIVRMHTGLISLRSVERDLRRAMAAAAK